MLERPGTKCRSISRFFRKMLPAAPMNVIPVEALARPCEAIYDAVFDRCSCEKDDGDKGRGAPGSVSSGWASSDNHIYIQPDQVCGTPAELVSAPS